MDSISFTQKGSFDNIESYLRRVSSSDQTAILNKYGLLGVQALSAATPVDSGVTAESWYYTIVSRPGYYSIRWHNRNVIGDTPVAILIQYGHATRNGGFIQGRDFIMPAMRPVFDQLVAEAWKEVTKS